MAKRYSGFRECIVTPKVGAFVFSLGVECATYRWLKRLRDTPNSMWMTPRITDIFILNELRKVSLLVATFQICVRDDITESNV